MDSLTTRRRLVAIAAASVFAFTAGAGGIARIASADAKSAKPVVSLAATPVAPTATPPVEKIATKPETTAEATVASRPPVLVATSEKGRLVVINTTTGKTERVLVTYPASNTSCEGLGESLSLTPDSKTVYFERMIKSDSECDKSIWSVAVTGGMPKKIVNGLTPRVSQDGTKLSYFNLKKAEGEGSDYSNIGDLRVRNLTTGAETIVATNVSCACGGQAFASWAPDGKQIAVQGTNCGCGGAPYEELRIYDAAKKDSFKAVPLPKTISDKAAWAYPTYTPDGYLFVLEIPKFNISAESFKAMGTPRILVVNPTTGSIANTITSGFEDRYYSSTSVDNSGKHLLYLSNGNLMVSDQFKRPTQLATGLIGASW